MNEIPETVSKVLDVLAEKFGATGRELWSAIVKQQYIDAIFDLVYSVATVIIGLIVFPTWFTWCDGSGLALAIWGAALFGTFLMALFSLQLAITGFYNPTYSAMKEIAGMFKKDSTNS